MASDPIAIDISHWQEDPLDFDKVKTTGVQAVVLKATQGLSYVDPTLAKRRNAAQQAGLLTSTYHFMENGKKSDIAKQIQHYLRTVNPQPGERMILDVEDTITTLNDIIAAVEALVADSRALQVTIYSGHVIKDLLKNNANATLSKYTSLWLAQYTTGTPSWPTAVWPKWTLWQYSDTGEVSGINGPVDVNRFNGTDDNFCKWIAPASVPAPDPTPTPDEDVPLVELTINSDRPIQLKLTVNANVNQINP